MDEEKPKKDAPEVEAKTRLDDMEDNIKSMKKGIDAITAMLAKAEEEKKDPEEDEIDKKKEVGSTPVAVKNEGEPKPGQGQVKLPQASAGETDETGKPAGGNGSEFVAKSEVNALVASKLQDLIKGMGITKTTTPRVNHQAEEIIKSNTNKDFAMDILKRAKEGKITLADMNTETKDFVKSEYDRRLSNLLNGGQ